MALRDQPYLPLYIEDFLTDEKLNECSPSAQGVYIKLMCIMHKSEVYGTILLDQKYKQTDDQIKNFALKLVKHLPFSEQVIYDALTELKNEKVLMFEDGKFWQKRMVKDNDISLKRSDAGQKGGFASNFARPKEEPKSAANSEYVNDIVIYLNKVTNKDYKSNTRKTVQLISARLNEGFSVDDFKKVIDIKSSQWIKDKDMCMYLRPETLFGTKFESYLNEAPKSSQSKHTPIQGVQSSLKPNPLWDEQ